jgi:hypothetical protein
MLIEKKNAIHLAVVALFISTFIQHINCLLHRYPDIVKKIMFTVLSVVFVVTLNFVKEIVASICCLVSM